MASRIMVTGGAGFIGSHLCDRLLARGDEVVALDNLDDYYDPAIKLRNLQQARDHQSFTFVEGDIRDAALLTKLGKTHNFDAIVHLAARAGVRPSIEQPTLYNDVNLVGTSRLLEFSQSHSIDHFVFASSSSVYGERTQTPFRETDRVDHPVSPYAATKKGGELLCHTFHHLFDLNVACLRFFTVYGPRQRPEMAIHRFTRMIDAGEAIPVFGDGTSQRDYTYIDDIVDGVIAALDRNRGYRVFNLGNHRMVTLSELVETIGSALGRNPEIDRQPNQPGDVSITCADISRAQEELGYQPSTPIEEGVRKFVDWYQQESIPSGSSNSD